MGYFIEHEGVIESVTTNLIRVKIIQTSACAGCHAKGVCSSSDQKTRIIDAVPGENQSYHTGDRVVLKGKQSYGLLAVWWAFFLPFLIMLLTLVVSGFLGAAEWKAGIMALAILVPYYIILSLFRDKLKNKFSFQIDHIVKS